MDLADQGEPLAYDVALSLAAEEVDLQTLEERSWNAARKLRALGIIVLLTRADTHRFRENLRYAATLRHDYLAAAALVRNDEARGREFAAGRFAGVFDAIASSDLGLAADIARLSPRAWRPELEYEDDFCYAWFIHGLVSAEGTAERPDVLLDRFESSLEGVPSWRLAVCRAFLRRDSAAFDEAFVSLLLERGQEIEARVESGELDDPIVVAERLVFVEGLGLLHLADRAGFKTQDEYLYCPSMARAATVAG